jgi:phosphoglucomutase
MSKFRNDPPAQITGIPVTRVLDYKTLTEKEIKKGETRKLNFPASDVIQFYLEDGTKVSVRPSGTEPKIKFYISVHAPLKSKDEFDSVGKTLDEKIKKIEQYLIS